jgi:hypothetical protein
LNGIQIHTVWNTQSKPDKFWKTAISTEQNIHIVLSPWQLEVSPSCVPSWKILQSPFWKLKELEVSLKEYRKIKCLRARDVVQWTVHLPNIYRVLGLIPSTTKQTE